MHLNKIFKSLNLELYIIQHDNFIDEEKNNERIDRIVKKTETYMKKYFTHKAYSSPSKG